MMITPVSSIQEPTMVEATLAALRECLTYLQTEWPSLTAQNNLPDMALTPCVAMILSAQARTV